MWRMNKMEHLVNLVKMRLNKIVFTEEGFRVALSLCLDESPDLILPRSKNLKFGRD